jgi:hypothetical protein
VNQSQVSATRVRAGKRVSGSSSANRPAGAKSGPSAVHRAALRTAASRPKSANGTRTEPWRSPECCRPVWWRHAGTGPHNSCQPPSTERRPWSAHETTMHQRAIRTRLEASKEC